MLGWLLTPSQQIRLMKRWTNQIVDNSNTLHWLLTTSAHYTGCWQHQHITLVTDNSNTTHYTVCWQHQHITLVTDNSNTLHWLLTTSAQQIRLAVHSSNTKHYNGCWQHQHNKYAWLLTTKTKQTGHWKNSKQHITLTADINTISLAVDDKNKAAWLLTTSKQQTGLTVGNSNQIN